MADTERLTIFLKSRLEKIVSLARLSNLKSQVSHLYSLLFAPHSNKHSKFNNLQIGYPRKMLSI